VEGASSFSDSVALHSAHDGRLYEKNYLSQAEMQSSDKKKRGLEQK